MENLAAMITVTFILHALYLGVVSQSRCELTELGQPHTFQCNIPGSGKTGKMYWRIAGATQCACNFITSRCDCSGLPHTATLSSSTTGGGYLATITITITRDHRDKNLTCEDESSGSSSTSTIVSECILSVFAGPESVRCTVPASVQIGDTNVTVTCEAQKDVFPNTACLFHKITNQGNSIELRPGANVTVQPEVKTCTLRVLGTSLGPGDHQFGVFMYPDVTGDQTDKQYGAASLDNTSINIAYPSAQLTECPTVNSADKEGDYLRNGTTATCKCTTSTQQTYFPVQMTWSDKNGVLQPQPTPSDTVTFTVTKDQVITCSVTNSLQWNKTDTYTPQVAYGPNSVDVTVEPTNQESLDLCQAASGSFTVQCQVSSPGVSPNATFTYTVNKTSTVVTQTPTDVNTSVGRVTVTEGGVYGVTCQVNNSIFSAIQAQDSVPVTVRKPPKAPSIELFQTRPVSPTSGDMLTVEEGGANVSCHVTGGYPPLTGLRLSCGENETFINSGSQTQMNTRFTKNMNGQSCSCVATHESKCYSSNTTSYLINVLYPPAVRIFNVTNIGNGTVEKGTTLAFVCEVEGNPRPTPSLQHDDGRDVTNVADGDTAETTVRHSQRMDCLDTGIYKCTAQTQERENSSTVEVNVLCPQQLDSSQSQNTVYDRKINSTFDINVTVYGYPKPTLPLQLHGHKEDLQQDDYSVTYTETRPPHGNVTLTFYSLTEKYFQNYTLTVTNTRGSLEYNFSISGYVASPSKDSDDLNAAAIGGGIAAAVVVILIIVLVVFIVRKKVNPCARKGDSSRKAGQDEEHVIPNDLYSGANSGEVVIDNSDLYSGNWNRKSNEVVIDNSDLYSGFSKPGSKEVVVDNSALYGKSDDFKETREALYKNYTDVTPSMTSATAVPVDMKASNGAKQGGNSSYEDVEVGAKSPGPSVQPKPKVAVKPMTAAKPTPAPKPGGPSTSGPQGAIVLQDDGVDQMYASVVRPVKPKAPKPQPTNQRESDYFPDQSKKPEIPEKKYEQEESLTGQEGKKKEQKSGGDKKKKNKKADEIPMVPKGGAAASKSSQNSSDVNVEDKTFHV